MAAGCGQAPRTSNALSGIQQANKSIRGALGQLAGALFCVSD